MLALIVNPVASVLELIGVNGVSYKKARNQEP
jgi:hypothetical protein